MSSQFKENTTALNSYIQFKSNFKLPPLGDFQSGNIQNYSSLRAQVKSKSRRSTSTNQAMDRLNGSFDLVTRSWLHLQPQQINNFLPLSLDISSHRFTDINPVLYLNKELYELQKPDYSADHHFTKKNIEGYFKRDVTILSALVIP